MISDETIVKLFDKRGGCILEVHLSSPGAVLVEIEASKARLRRGEIGYFEVIRPRQPVERIMSA